MEHGTGHKPTRPCLGHGQAERRGHAVKEATIKKGHNLNPECLQSPRYRCRPRLRLCQAPQGARVGGRPSKPSVTLESTCPLFLLPASLSDSGHPKGRVGSGMQHCHNWGQLSAVGPRPYFHAGGSTPRNTSSPYGRGNRIWPFRRCPFSSLPPSVIARSACDAAIQGDEAKYWSMSPWIATPKPARNDGSFEAGGRLGQMRSPWPCG